jgi:hypothetical protein
VDEMIKFFKARLDADQKYGQACLQAHSRAWVEVGHRTIREVEAKRKILAHYQTRADVYDWDDLITLESVIKNLIAVHADHPAYCEEWRPK